MFNASMKLIHFGIIHRQSIPSKKHCSSSCPTCCSKEWIQFCQEMSIWMPYTRVINKMITNRKNIKLDFHTILHNYNRKKSQYQYYTKTDYQYICTMSYDVIFFIENRLKVLSAIRNMCIRDHLLKYYIDTSTECKHRKPQF